eukprot:9051448-Pyramimonas_sp.AAC.1
MAGAMSLRCATASHGCLCARKPPNRAPSTGWRCRARRRPQRRHPPGGQAPRSTVARTGCDDKGG